MEETVSGARVVRWPTLTFQKHMSFHVRYMALTFRQVNCPAISPMWDSWSALTFRCPNMEVLGGSSSTNILQPLKKSPNLWRHHGKFHKPLTTVQCGREILLLWFGVLFRSKHGILIEYSYMGGYSGQWSLQLAFTAWPLDRSLWPFLYIGV